jgi:hypothetical protein
VNLYTFIVCHSAGYVTYSQHPGRDVNEATEHFVARIGHDLNKPLSQRFHELRKRFVDELREGFKNDLRPYNGEAVVGPGPKTFEGIWEYYTWGGPKRFITITIVKSTAAPDKRVQPRASGLMS